MPIVHIVLFEFKPSVESEVIQDVSFRIYDTVVGLSAGCFKHNRLDSNSARDDRPYQLLILK